MNVKRNSRPGRLLVVLALPLLTLLLLFVVLGLLQQPAHAQEPTAPPPAQQSAAGADPGAPDQPPTCNRDDPIPGQSARLIGDDEILVFYRYEPTYLRNQVMNWDGVKGTLITGPARDWGGLPKLATGLWLSAAGSDLNGDRKAELVAGFKNADKEIGAIADPFTTVVASDWSNGIDRWRGDNLHDVDVAAGNLDPVDTGDAGDEIAVAFRDRYEDIHVLVLNGKADGTIANADNSQTSDVAFDHRWEDRGNVHYVAVATGDLNLDGHDNEIVTAYQDSDKDLQVIVLRQQNDAYHTLKEIYAYHSEYADPAWDNVAESHALLENWRPIDVTTGDLDGDNQDEVVVGFRDGHYSLGLVTLLVLDVTAENKDTQMLQMSSNLVAYIGIETSQPAYAPTSVSISAADLDGDGFDEIAVGYNVVECDGLVFPLCWWQQHLVTYKYGRYHSPEWWQNCPTATGSCLYQRPGRWASQPKAFSNSSDPDDNRAEGRISVATGDLDRDGMAEIALARSQAVWDDITRRNNDLEVYAFDADRGAANGLAVVKGAPLTIDPGPKHLGEFALAMGDLDGDSLWGDYNNSCRTEREAVLQAVIHAPPFWPEGRGWNGLDNDYRTEGGFGLDVSIGGGSGETAETKIGGSATVSVGGEWQGFGAGASMTSEWEHKTSLSEQKMTATTNGFSTSTTSPLNVDNGEGEKPDWEALSLIEQYYWCYDYTAEDELGVIPVCLPIPGWTMLAPTTVEWWYRAGPATYRRSWVPVGMNLAEDKTRTHRVASESSVWNISQPYGEAWRAVDGDTNGDHPKGSIAHTLYEQDPWWQVNLGGVQWIDAIQVWNRTDCCTEQLKDFHLLVTDKADFPKDPTDPTGKRYLPLDQLLAREDVWHYPANGLPFPGPAGRPTTIPVNAYGRVVRIQMNTGDTGSCMNIAEVQVYGMPGTPDQWPKTIAPDPLTTATGPFTLTWRDGQKQDVNGKLYLVWNRTQLLVRSGDPGFSTGTRQDQQAVIESSDAETYSFGMELKSPLAYSVDTEHSWGTSYKTSEITTWGTGLTFSGRAEGVVSGGPMVYSFKPYIWLQQVTPPGGGAQKFLVLDYTVPSATQLVNSIPPATVNLAPVEAAPPEGLSDAPLVAPQAPRIRSSTHPDPDTWYTGNAATFTWRQPSGDPATVETYHWFLDRNPDTVPQGFHLGLTSSYTYDPLSDGIWYLHVRAMSDGQEWGETAHRMIHVDANPPQVSLALDPPYPTGNGEWYVTPVEVMVSAAEEIGSGVASVEVSTDGLTWQPYTAPLAFSADTPGTTVHARAADAVGNVAEPVSTTIKIDRTPPDSHVEGGAGPGTWVAEVKTNAAGNEELVLAGAITDRVSGRADMILGFDGLDWVGPTVVGSWYPLPDPAIELNWVYTATDELGAGYHIFTGQALDQAGNREEAYEIGRVLWLPRAAPDLGGSSLVAAPATVRPGEEVLFTLVARNGGFQEAHVAIVNTLPAGLEPILAALPSGATYDPAARTLTWPAQLLWPGDSERHSLLARVDAGLGATKLETQATFHAFWPNTDLLPDAERQKFEDREQTAVVTATVVVDPDLPAGADVTPPWALLVPPVKQVVNGPEVALDILAVPDARRMYLREWTPDPTSGDWIVAQDSGWIDYGPTITWTLSAGQGVKYLGVWLADEAGNVSRLNEHSLKFVNRMDGSQALADGQRVQYRGNLKGGELVSGVLKTVSGDPDLYLWQPGNAFWPDRYSRDTVRPGQGEYLSYEFDQQAGRYLLEVQAVGASEYELVPTGQRDEMAPASHAALEKALPQHPLTASDPLSAGQLGPEVSLRVSSYLPVVLRGS